MDHRDVHRRDLRVEFDGLLQVRIGLVDKPTHRIDVVLLRVAYPILAACSMRHRDIGVAACGVGKGTLGRVPLPCIEKGAHRKRVVIEVRRKDAIETACSTRLRALRLQCVAESLIEFGRFAVFDQIGHFGQRDDRLIAILAIRMHGIRGPMATGWIRIGQATLHGIDDVFGALYRSEEGLRFLLAENTRVSQRKIRCHRKSVMRRRLRDHRGRGELTQLYRAPSSRYESDHPNSQECFPTSIHASPPEDGTPIVNHRDIRAQGVFANKHKCNDLPSVHE
jgi:hypothetical protein